MKFVAGATGETGRIVQESSGIFRPRFGAGLTASQSSLPEAAELVVGDVLKPQPQCCSCRQHSTICATGAKPSFDPTGPYKVDYEGLKILSMSPRLKELSILSLFLLCTSQLFHPLNLFWLILVWKKQAEEYIQKSLTYTIVRPGV